VYAPALVAWVGGPRFSMAVGFGGGGAGVAWFPLGPREVYVPAYRASPVYVNRVNVTNTVIVNNNVNITNINATNIRYANREAPGAVTAVPQNSFASARSVQSAAIPVRGEALQSAQVMNTAPVAPSRASVVGGYAGGRVAQPPMSTQNRSVVTRTAPPPAQVPFAQRQQALSANPGRPLDSSQVQQLRSNQPQAAPSFVRPSRVGMIPQVQQPGSPKNYPQQARPQRDTAPPRFEREVQPPPRPQPVVPQRDAPQRDAPQREIPQREVPQVRPERQVAPERQAPPARQVQRDQRREERKDERDKKQ
jgi:hypothetical protein